MIMLCVLEDDDHISCYNIYVPYAATMMSGTYVPVYLSKTHACLPLLATYVVPRSMKDMRNTRGGGECM